MYPRPITCGIKRKAPSPLIVVMKKVLIGILILIPIIILLIIALVTNLLSIEAWVAVDDIKLIFKNSASTTNLELSLAELAGEKHNFSEWLEVKVMPEKANRYKLEWQISSLKCTDEAYEKEYDSYVQSGESGTPVPPAAMLVDDENSSVDKNQSGDFVVSAYCYFDVIVSAETVSKHFTVFVKGYTVEDVKLVDLEGEDNSDIAVGESVRLVPRYTPIDSIVEQLTFSSSDESVAQVDKNGVVTALGEGSATITASASKYGDGGFEQSSAYTVNVHKALSAHGNSLTVGRRADKKYTFDELGVLKEAVLAGEGYEILSDGITLDADSVSLRLRDGDLAINVVEPDDIAIRNAHIFEYMDEGDFILAVSPLKLYLTAVWADMLRSGAPNVEWQSSDASVATVNELGEVTPISSGITIITATSETGDVASMLINVQQKVTSIRLITSQQSLSKGLAQETVFASYVYDSGTGGGIQNNNKRPAEFLLRLQGEPEDSASEEEKAYFYSSYRFEVVEGEEYAAFDDKDLRKLVFKPEAIEGKRTVDVKVRVSAKYPRYEGVQTHTVEEVVLKVAYGVMVETWEQLMFASADQKEFTSRAEYYVPESVEATITAPNGKDYFVKGAPYSTGRFAIVFGANLRVPEDKIVDNGGKAGSTCLKLYGDLYGNDYLIAARLNQVQTSTAYLIQICRGEITVSNVRVRSVDEPLDQLEKSMFEAFAILVWNADISRDHRMHGIKVEYSTIENAMGALRSYNADLDVKGCIFSNMSAQAVYCLASVTDRNELMFSRLNIRNCVFTSMLAMSLFYDYSNFYTVPEKDKQGRLGRFSADPADREANYAWVESELKPRGYIPALNQTGFLDIYNWQDIRNTSLIQFGDKTIDDVVAVLAEKILSAHPDFQPAKYTIKDPETGYEDYYFHLGFMISGIKSMDWDERPIIDEHLEDSRFMKINCRTLTEDVPSNLKSYTRILKQLELVFYSYSNKASLTPNDVFELNSDVIARLHG